MNPSMKAKLAKINYVMEKLKSLQQDESSFMAKNGFHNFGFIK